MFCALSRTFITINIFRINAPNITEYDTPIAEEK